MKKYDLCIIGAGPSGYAAAMRAVDFGKKVVLIEKDKVGGAGLYNGALSSKTMWELSQKLRTINEGIQSVGRRRLNLKWEEGTLSSKNFSTHHSFGVLYRNFPLCLSDSDNTPYHQKKESNHNHRLDNHHIVTCWSFKNQYISIS